MITIQKEVRLKDFEPDGYANYVFNAIDENLPDYVWLDLEDEINVKYGAVSRDDINNLFDSEDSVANLLGFVDFDDVVKAYNSEERL